MRRSRHMLWGALGVAGLSVALAARAIQVSSVGAELPVPDFTDLQEAWTRATHNTPLPTAWISFASNALQKPESTGKSAGGVTLIGGVSGAAASVPATPVAILPVVSLGAADAQEANRRSMALQLFLTAVSRYRPGRAAVDAGASGPNSTLVQALPTWTRATHVELLVTEAIFLLQAGTRQEKCVHYGRLQEHAGLLGWNSSNPAAGAVPTNAAAQVPALWTDVELNAKSFYTTSLGGQPALQRVCDLSVPVSNDDVEHAVKDRVETRMVERFQELAAQVGSALEGPLSNLGILENQSAVNVPTEEMLELDRTVQNTTSLVRYVQNDELGLEKGTTPWRAQAVDAQQRAQNELKNQVGGMDQLDAGRADLAAATQDLLAIVAKLKEFGGLSGQASELAACRDISVPSSPAAAQNEALLTALDACLGAIGGAHARLKTAAGQDSRMPAFRDFVTKVAGLSERIAEVYRFEANSTH